MHDCKLSYVVLKACMAKRGAQGFGFTKDWKAMVGLRIILGILEAGFFPGCAYLLSCWYPRYQLQKRNAAFYLIGSMASALSGILAYGLMQMKGLAGLGGWCWIFIVSLFPTSYQMVMIESNWTS